MRPGPTQQRVPRTRLTAMPSAPVATVGPTGPALKVRDWIVRNIIADDPLPVPSALDRWDHCATPAPWPGQAEQQPANVRGVTCDVRHQPVSLRQGDRTG